MLDTCYTFSKQLRYWIFVWFFSFCQILLFKRWQQFRKRSNKAEKKDADDKGSGTRRVVQELLAPKPKGADDKKDGAPEGDAVGYGNKARQQMDRLNEILKDR